MALPNLLRRINLGNEFDVGNIVANRIKLKIGAGLARELDGTIVALPQPSISVTEIAMCIDDGAGGALKVIRRATFTDGVETALVYIDADDNVTEHAFTSIVDCCL